MTFVHGYLLAGLVVLGVPVLIHLLHRQKPQRMPFPAFRFLKLKRTTNRRKMRLRNLLLLLARLLVLLLVIFALARPQLRGAKSPLNGTQPVLAVLIFDTSPSMDYASAGASRLDEARTRAQELLAQIAPESKVRVIETGEPLPPPSNLDGWMQGRSLVEGRIGGLRTRPVVEPLPRLIEGGVALLARAAQEDNRPRVLVVFGDRTLPSWPGAAGKKVPDEVTALFVDVGMEKPRDLAIESIETSPAVVVPGGKLDVRVWVRATGADFNTELRCEIENDPARDQSPLQVRLGDGQRQRYDFQRTVPSRPANAPNAPDAPIQVVASLRTSDALAFNNIAFATVPVRTKRKLLLIADSAKDAKPVRTALKSLAVKNPADAFEVTQVTGAEAAKLTPARLQGYVVVILNEVAEPKPALWDGLAGSVENGGGLIIIPGGDEMERFRDAFNADGQKVQLLPGTLKRLVKVPPGQPGVRWKDFQRGHPLTEAFRAMLRAGKVDFADPTLGPQVLGYWEVEPTDKATVVSTYNVKGEWAALLEKRHGRGRVLMFTLPLDGRPLDATRGWHNYWKDSAFGLVLIDLACQDLAGRVSLPALNFQRGQEVRLAPPSPLPPAPFKLTGPGLSDSETRVTWNAPANAGAPGKPLPDIVLPQATSAGNYQLRDNKDRIFMAFSITEPAEESNLARVPPETIAAVLGEKALLPVGHDVKLAELLGTSFAPPPTELLPLVLLGLLAFLVLESWLANRYYKPVPETEEQAQSLRPTGELTRSRI